MHEKLQRNNQRESKGKKTHGGERAVGSRKSEKKSHSDEQPSVAAVSPFLGFLDTTAAAE